MMRVARRLRTGLSSTVRAQRRASAARRPASSASNAATNAHRNAAIQKRRDARRDAIKAPYAAPAVDATERVGSHGVYLRHSTFEDEGACEALTQLLRRWSAHSLVKAVVVEGVQGAFTKASPGDRATLYRAAAACDAPIVQLVDGLLLPGGLGLGGRGFRVCGDGAVFVPPLGEAALAAGVTSDGGMAFACSRHGNYGRAALVSGLPVRGTALKACGLATHVVTDHALDRLAEELADVADQASDAAAARVAIEQHLEDREVASLALLDEESEAQAAAFVALADAAFGAGDVDAILGRLAQLDGDDAAEAAAQLSAHRERAGTLLGLAEKSAGLGFEGALRLEAEVLGES
jgi:hypothetical protein